MRRRRVEGRQTAKKEDKVVEKVLEKVESGKGASSVVGEEEERKVGVLESVQEMVWGKK